MLQLIWHFIDNCSTILETQFQVYVTNGTNLEKCVYAFRVSSRFALCVHIYTELQVVAHLIVFRKDCLA